MAELESILQYLRGYLALDEVPDYPNALNGLQVAGPSEVKHLAAAVDASEAAIRLAVDRGADLLLVHHGLFWEGLEPLVGPRFRKVEALVRGGVGLYSVHLPLDAHPEVGNCALLARALGVELRGRFGEYRGVAVGWWGTVEASRVELRERLEELLGGPVRVIPGGPERVERVGILTGGGGSALREAAAAGLDALVTGEGGHHTYFYAVEEGVNAFYGGHYATETFGVKALAEHLAQRFDLTWEFLELPTGM